MFKNHCFSSIHTSERNAETHRLFPVKSHWVFFLLPRFDHSSTSRHRKALKSHDVEGFRSRCLFILKMKEKLQQVEKTETTGRKTRILEQCVCVCVPVSSHLCRFRAELAFHGFRLK